ncbi:MAG TPA: M20 family metallopeptidase [bacterium]|nr:M20 family metallopeptidase [bacterium]
MPDDPATTARTLLAATTRRLREATETLRTLVELDTSSHNPQGLTEAAVWVAAQLRSLGLAVERRDSGAPIVLGRLRGTGRRRILLLGHFDTVFEPGEAARRPFRVEGTRAYGPGVADMKGGVVAIWEALRALAETDQQAFGVITVLHNADEEIGSPGSRAAIEAAARAADVCLVAEPGRPDGSVVTARKGIARYTLRVRGRAAHAGVNPEDGASAMVALAHKILALDALNDRQRGISVNTVVLEGGTRSNVIPERAVGEIDVRFFSAADGAAVLPAVERVAAAMHVPGTSAELEGGLNRPPMEAGASAGLFALAADAAAAMGLTLTGTATGGGSDGNFAAALGVPVLDGLGPVGGGFHSAAEYLDLATLPQRAALIAAVICGVSRDESAQRSGA